MSDFTPTRTATRYRALGRNVLLKNLAETSRLFQMCFFIVVARRFGPTGLGDLTVLLMIGSVVGLVFGDLGINTTMIARMNGAVGKARGRIASTGLVWKIVLSALSFLLMTAAMRLTVGFGTWPEILAVAVISCGSLWHEFLASLTNGVNRLDAEAWLRLIFRAAVYGGGAVICFFFSLVGVLYFMAVAAVLVLGVAFVVLHLHVTPVSGSRILPGFLRQSVPVWITQVAQLTYLKLDVVVLGVLHVAAREVGWYAAGWKIVDVLTVVPALLAGAVLPLISGALPDTDASAIAPGYLKAMYIVPFFFVLPLAIGAQWITHLFFGVAFLGTPAVLGILVWGLVPISAHTFLATLSIAVSRQAEAAELGAVTGSSWDSGFRASRTTVRLSVYGGGFTGSEFAVCHCHDMPLQERHRIHALGSGAQVSRWRPCGLWAFASLLPQRTGSDADGLRDGRLRPCLGSARCCYPSGSHARLAACRLIALGSPG